MQTKMITQNLTKDRLEQLEQFQEAEVNEVELDETKIEEGLVKSASAVRNFLVNKFDEVIKDEEMEEN